MTEPTFEELISDALAAPVVGWDFSWLQGRWSVGPLPWSYQAEVERHAATASSMLDIGTGGGELLSITARAPFTVATESWPPNVAVAHRRLRPLGVPVVQEEGAPDDPFSGNGPRWRLPFRDGAFDLVVNRHEEFVPAEVARILRPGGVFVTQQTDSRTYDDFYAALDLDRPEEGETRIPAAVEQCRRAGLRDIDVSRGEERMSFFDVGALVYYLKAVIWAVPDFDVVAQELALRRLHRGMRAAPLCVRQRRFLLVAAKPRGREQGVGAQAGR